MFSSWPRRQLHAPGTSITVTRADEVSAPAGRLHIKTPPGVASAGVAQEATGAIPQIGILQHQNCTLKKKPSFDKVCRLPGWKTHSCVDAGTPGGGEEIVPGTNNFSALSWAATLRGRAIPTSDS